MKTLKKQKGFALFEVLFFLLLAAVLVGGAYYVGKHQNKTSSNETSASTNNPAAKSSALSNKFTFKELGVQITLPKELLGLSYTHGSGDFYVLTTPEFNRTKMSCPVEGFSTIFKKTGQFDSTAPREGSSGLLKQFDQFHIAYGDPIFGAGLDPTCESTYQNITDTQDRLTASLREAFKTATEIQ